MATHRPRTSAAWVKHCKMAREDRISRATCPCIYQVVAAVSLRSHWLALGAAGLGSGGREKAGLRASVAVGSAGVDRLDRLSANARLHPPPVFSPKARKSKKLAGDHRRDCRV